MRVAVIGAGAAGLCAAQQLCSISNEDLSFVVYEQTGDIGGTWVYTKNTSVDEYGLPIHSSMYKNLRTNLPKEAMEFLSFPFKHEKSFLQRTDVLQYLKDFADHYGLKNHMKFYHQVIQITPVNEIWEVTVENLQTNVKSTKQFDAVMVCNGHYSDPRFPEYPGMDVFENVQMHSHSYREPDQFEGKRVVVVGSGPSGIDITVDIAPFAEKVYISHHNPALINTGFPKNVVHKPDIKSLSDKSVVFQDGTVEAADVILYCTGYNYSFPFLNKDCGITINDNFVWPLYKHFININKPTMCFIGIPWQTLVFPLFELQVNCFLNALFKKIKLPSKDEMFLSLEKEIDLKKEKGLKPRYYHLLGGYNVRHYVINIANTFNAKPIPEVVLKVFECTGKRREEDRTGYREDVYEIIDSDNYVLHKNKMN